MPEKTTSDGRTYRIEGRTFVWFPEGDDGQPTGAEVRIPLRIKLKVLRALSGREMDNDVMFELLEALIPEQVATLDEMDILDFQACFSTWQSEYNSLSGASLGESSGSSS